mmetsp:Transcript_13296/g.43316  ORF Transcript_13296/g.43316 Transcript_13296/m.43316 type:complete len:341 (+) Transcript_13296:924-1946(+)
MVSPMVSPIEAFFPWKSVVKKAPPKGGSSSLCQVVAVGAMVANGVEGVVEEEKSRRLCRVTTTALAVGTGIWCVVSSSSDEEPIAALATTALFAASSWTWVVEPPLSLAIPYSLLASVSTTLVSRRGRSFLAGRVACGNVLSPVVLGATLGLSVATIAALCAWSLLIVKGDHGVLQDLLGPMLSRRWIFVPIFGLGNALVEEVEFRGVILGAFFSTTVGPGVVLQAALFAAQHVRGGFPNGTLGGALVFAWGLALGLLRVVSGGILAGYVVHVVADTTIAILLARQHAILASSLDVVAHRPDDSSSSDGTTTTGSSSRGSSSAPKRRRQPTRHNNAKISS